MKHSTSLGMKSSHKKINDNKGSSSAIVPSRRVRETSVKDYADNFIKHSSKCVVFSNGEFVYKQFSLKSLYWTNEVFLVNYLNSIPTISQKNIIKFKKCEILDDYKIDENGKVCINKKEKVIRITMNKYNAPLDKLKNFKDDEIFFIMNKILIAVLFCLSKDIMHRDIKEKNIFVNYDIKPDKNRIITHVVLADFNISSINYYAHEIKTPRFGTITHRPPELHRAIRDSRSEVYGENTDMWSFCVVLSFMVTNHSFYLFLNDGYLQIMPDIIYDDNKLQIAMGHFLKIYANKKLKHLDFYKKVIFLGICPKKDRILFSELFNMVIEYNRYHTHFELDSFELDDDSPKAKNSKIIVKNTAFIRKYHNELQMHDSVLMLFYKSVIYTSAFVGQNILKSKSFLFTLYILLLMTSDDNHRRLSHYIQLFSIFGYNITIDEVYDDMQKILYAHNFNILH